MKRRIYLTYFVKQLLLDLFYWEGCYGSFRILNHYKRILGSNIIEFHSTVEFLLY